MKLLRIYNKEEIKEFINAIEKNYPTENYTKLRAALDYCLEMLRSEVKND